LTGKVKGKGSASLPVAMKHAALNSKPINLYEPQLWKDAAALEGCPCGSHGRNATIAGEI